MRIARDTFLHFLADNLSGINVHGIRRDPNDPAAGLLQMEAVNVCFDRVDMGVVLSTIFGKIDVISASELSATDMMQEVWQLLSGRFYTPMLDYTNPTSPVDTGTTLMWKRGGVRFMPVENDSYYNFSCTLPIQFHLPLL